MIQRTYPVIEVFGPTIQGEGALAGCPTLFVRFGGCDYRCSWCDSMYAVDPALVRENAKRMTAEEIVESLVEKGRSRSSRLWVTLSGGNPALMNFDPAAAQYAFVAGLHRNGFKVAVETQGSVWRDWLEDVDHLTVSPKPPSSGMATPKHDAQTVRFIERAESAVVRHNRSLKIVVFDEADYAWAADYCRQCGPEWDCFLSVGTDQDALQDEYRLQAGISDRYRWLCETVSEDLTLPHVRVIPQLHVIAWGAKRGV